MEINEVKFEDTLKTSLLEECGGTNGFVSKLVHEYDAAPEGSTTRVLLLELFYRIFFRDKQ